MHNTGKHVKINNERVEVNWIKIAAIVILIAAILVSGYVINTKVRYKKIENTYAELSGSYTAASKSQMESNDEDKAKGSLSSDEDMTSYFPITVDFRSLLEKDNNIVGWIYSKDTKIDYPIFQGTDNEYYLTNGMNGQYTGYGGIFLDAGNTGDFSNSNSILYGHHMQDGSFFASIYKYVSQDYYEEHPVLWLGTPTQNYRADVYSCYITPADSEAYTIRFTDINHFNNWLNNTVNNSLIKTEVMPNIGSKILTLSTCSYEYDNARCVIHCILTAVS